MKTLNNMKMIAGFLALTLSSTSFAGFTYDFPGCNAGTGIWPADQIKINDDVCSNFNPYNEISFGGHCNGRLVLEIKCTDGEAKSVKEIKDCYCD